jgi:hypothetical protein
MTRISLTSRPRVPVLVRATALGTLALGPTACGDDGDTSTTAVSTDVAPTAGPCYHDPTSPGCESTGPGTTSGTTGTSTAADSATDIAPTAGPCAHEPDLPECASTTDGGSDSGTATEDSTGTGTGTGTGTSSG